MTFGVRKKLILFLVVVALLPLLTAVVTISLSLSRLRTNTLAQNSVSLARSEATARSISLVRDIELVTVATREPAVLARLQDVTKRPQAELKQLDALWPTLPETDPRLRDVLDNEVSNLLKHITRTDPRFGEILVTDRYGQLIAANHRSTDFFQGDEDWWKESFAGGQGEVRVYPVSYDASLGQYGIEVAVPIGPKGQVVGVVKAILTLDRWMEQITPPEEGLDAGLMLVRSDGTIIYRQQVAPLTAVVPRWHEITSGTERRQYRDVDDELHAYAPISLPDQLADFKVVGPEWWLVIYTPRSQIMGPVWRITALTLGIGLLIIGGLFLLGLYLIERSITRRIVAINEATSRVSRGDLAHRVQLPARRLLGGDELDELTAGFNLMIENVQKSTQGLQSANQLKTDFIRIAGHELRTPVSYILGMARLLKDSADATRLQFAVQSMGAKAKRLNEIIQAMFKLMPMGLHTEDMHYSDVGLSELLEEIYVDVFPFIETRSQRLIIEMIDKIPPLRVDREKLRDVLENLLMNAIKFTPDGGIIKVRASLALGERVSVSVQDQGPGIPEQEYPRLFQPFYSGGDVMTHSTGDVGYQKRGIGLGLAIVRHFTELHGGTVHVSSSPLGSTFSITLPIRPPQELQQGPGEPPPPPAS